jgi:hypothetical protein
MGAAGQGEGKLKSPEIVNQTAFGLLDPLPEKNVPKNRKVRYRAVKTARATVPTRVFYRPIAANDFAVVAGPSVLKPCYLQGCGVKQQFVATTRAFALFE